MAIAVDNLADGDDDDDGGGENAEEGEAAEVVVQGESKEPGNVSLQNLNFLRERKSFLFLIAIWFQYFFIIFDNLQKL